MSRSFRKTKIFSMTSGGGRSGTQKKFKIYEHQAERTNVKMKLRSCDDFEELILPSPKEYGNEWASPRDGKSYWENATKKDMRK